MGLSVPPWLSPIVRICNLNLFVNLWYNTTMEAKAKELFLRKIVINGFSIQEEANRLTLRPRGAEATAEITLEEVEVNVWRVKSASGRYAGFARGSKRSYFEAYLNQWVSEAQLQAAE